MSMPAGGGAWGRWRRSGWRDSVFGWVIVLGILGAILLVPALCVMGVILEGTDAGQSYPILRRVGLSAGALILAAVSLGFGIACLATFRRTWRLRLHGQTTRGQVLSRYATPGGAETSPIEHAVVRVGLGTVDVALLWGTPPQVGDEIRVRYDPANPANAAHARWTVGGVIATVVMEAIVIFFGAGGILLGLFFLYATVGILSGELIDGLGPP